MSGQLCVSSTGTESWRKRYTRQQFNSSNKSYIIFGTTKFTTTDALI